MTKSDSFSWYTNDTATVTNECGFVEKERNVKVMANMKKVYRKIAKQNGITVEEVKREMREAISAAYVNPNFYARCIPCKGSIPTPDEFISYAVNRVSVIRETK